MEIALSGGWITVLGSDGSVRVKENSIYSGWTTLWSIGATGVVLDGNRIAVLAGGTAYVKEGCYSGWGRPGRRSERPRALRWPRRSCGRRYGLGQGRQPYSGWVALAATDRVVLASDRIGVLTGQNGLVKDGPYSGWTTVATGSVTALAVSSSRIAVVKAGTVEVNEGSSFGTWVAVSCGA